MGAGSLQLEALPAAEGDRAYFDAQIFSYHRAAPLDVHPRIIPKPPTVLPRASMPGGRGGGKPAGCQDGETSIVIMPPLTAFGLPLNSGKTC